MRSKIEIEREMRKELDRRILATKSDKLHQMCGRDFAQKLKAYVRLYTEEQARQRLQQ